MNNDKIIAAIAPAFTALMIEKIQNLKTGWNKPWVSMAQGCPRNLAGRYYNGGNLFMLLLLTEYKHYKTPIFLTYKQAQEAEINVKKGEKSFPVYFWYLYAIPKDKKDGKGKPYEQYARLSDEQKKVYDTVLKAQLACCGFAKAGYSAIIRYSISTRPICRRRTPNAMRDCWSRPQKRRRRTGRPAPKSITWSMPGNGIAGSKYENPTAHFISPAPI